MKHLLIILCFACLLSSAQTKVVVRNATNKVVYVGQPPWAGQDTLTNFTIYDIGNQPVPEKPTYYFYTNGEFVFDPTDSIEADNAWITIMSVFQAMSGKTFAELTAAQKSQMIEGIMWELGIIGRNRRIKSPNVWLRRR
jgi:hypothetical protein